jgi:hypothetical protein
MIRSAARSLTRRKALANDARKALAAFQDYATAQQAAEKAGDTDSADLYWDQAAKRLLWAEAHAQRALYLHTGGRLGVKDATLVTVLRQHEERARRDGR